MRRTNMRDRGRVAASESTKEERIMKAHVRRLAYLESYVLVTPCRLFGILIVTTCIIIVLLLSIDKEGRPGKPPRQVNISEGPYVFDYSCVREEREEMLQHYGYSRTSAEVEKRSILDIDEFWDLYDGKWPVILTDIIPQWKAYKSWSKEFFLREYGDDRIVLTAVQGGIQEGVAHVRDMRTFVQLLEQPVGPRVWTYMVDEMFLILRPELRNDVGPNPLLDENFFDLFPREIKPWDSMMLWGTKYSRSPLHMDPYNWTAVSAVIWGRKKWKFSIQHSAATTFCPVDAFDPDYLKYPRFGRAEYLEVEQYSGELLIIPSGWYHQAYNDEETLSISSQLMNRNNYLIVLEEIIKGKNLNRKKLPPLFHSLLPPDQVKLFLSLIPKKILKKGKAVTDYVLSSLNECASKSQDTTLPT